VTRIRSSAAAALAAVCAIAGCGGGGDKTTASSPTQTAPATTPTTPPQTATAPPPATTSTSPTTPTKPPPSTSSTTPGGSEPARTELTFTGSKSGIRPRQASVAPFVAVRISLVSADRSRHTLAVDGHTLRVGGTRKSEFVELPGLRPGKTYSAVADGRVKIRILSSNEPGP
jgi:cytoskeletal protein RodZ